MRTLSVTLMAVSALALGSAAAAAPGKASRLSLRTDIGAQGQAQGTPRRDPTIPPGLSSVFERRVPGILVAIQRTIGSNSRLQDLPVSP